MLKVSSHCCISSSSSIGRTSLVSMGDVVCISYFWALVQLLNFASTIFLNDFICSRSSQPIKTFVFIIAKNKFTCQLTGLCQPSWVIPSETHLLLLNWKKTRKKERNWEGRGKRGCAQLIVTNLFSWVQHLSSRQINSHFINISSSLLWSDCIPPWGAEVQVIYLRHVLTVPWIFWNEVFQIISTTKSRLAFLRTFFSSRK